MSSIDVTIEFKVPGAGPKRVDANREEIERTGPDTFKTKLSRGTHDIDWAAQGAPNSPYSIEITEPASVEPKFESRTDHIGRCAGGMRIAL